MTAGKPPLRYQALGRFFEVADAVIPRGAFALPGAEALLAAARTGIDPAAAEGLQTLLAALAADSRLTLFGRLSVRWDMIRLLRNASLVARAHAARPELGLAPVAAPIFILGLPRSGTTFLHTLMAQDPAVRVPRQWQTMFPGPRPADFSAARSPEARQVDRQLRIFDAMAPGFAAAHPVTADSPQECSEITAHVFRSYRFDTIFRVPKYLEWLDREGDLAGFAFHKMFLQLLQDGTPQTWVLKCPDHTFSLDAILATYPDAQFIVVHRDPMEVLASNTRFTALLRRPFLRNIDPLELGRLDSERWIDGANRLVAFDRRPDIDANRKFHVRHDDLIAAPMDTIGAIYARFNRRLGADAAAAMAQTIAAVPHGGYARHAAYPLASFGLDPGFLNARFAGYVDRYCGV